MFQQQEQSKNKLVLFSANIRPHLTVIYRSNMKPDLSQQMVLLLEVVVVDVLSSSY